MEFKECWEWKYCDAVSFNLSNGGTWPFCFMAIKFSNEQLVSNGTLMPGNILSIL